MSCGAEHAADSIRWNTYTPGGKPDLFAAENPRAALLFVLIGEPNLPVEQSSYCVTRERLPCEAHHEAEAHEAQATIAGTMIATMLAWGLNRAALHRIVDTVVDGVEDGGIARKEL